MLLLHAGHLCVDPPLLSRRRRIAARPRVCVCLCACMWSALCVMPQGLLRPHNVAATAERGQSSEAASQKASGRRTTCRSPCEPEERQRCARARAPHALSLSLSLVMASMRGSSWPPGLSAGRPPLWWGRSAVALVCRPLRRSACCRAGRAQLHRDIAAVLPRRRCARSRWRRGMRLGDQVGKSVRMRRLSRHTCRTREPQPGRRECAHCIGPTAARHRTSMREGSSLAGCAAQAHMGRDLAV